MKWNLLNEISSLRKKPAEKSVYAFAKYYMEHHLKLLPSAAHKEIYELLTDIVNRRGKRVAIAAPRGFGKSTMITLFYIIYSICYLKERFIVILSDTASQAEQTLENVKKELTENEKIRVDFPEVFEKDGRPKPPRWTQSQIETLNGVKVLALGSGQKIRGRKFGKDRPTLVIADDIETQDNTLSEASRDKTKIWFTKSVLMAGDENTNFIFLGTIYHPLCLLGEYLSQKSNYEWIKKVFKVIVSEPKHPELWMQWSDIYNFRKDFEGNLGPMAAKSFYIANRNQMDEGVVLLWPEKWSYYDLVVLREEDRLSFYCELQNEPYDLKTAIFNVEKFHYVEKTHGSLDTFLNARQGWLEFYGSCDPAMGEDAAKGDYTAVIIAARDIQDGRLYVIEADISRRSPQETITRIVEYCKMYRPLTFFVETNLFQKLLMDNLGRDLYEQGINTPVLGIDNRGDKTRRIHSLEPSINNGYIQFSLSHTRLLDQFRFFPNGQHEDGLDALEMIVSNIQTTPYVWKNPTSSMRIRVESNVLRGVPDLRSQSIPRVYNDRDKKDRFIPDPNVY
jgi:predicted phage terminase large subunit-like protein